MPIKRFTPLKSFILGVLITYNQDMSGYELIKIAKEWRFDHYIKATKASFYYTIKKLQDGGFIKEIGSKQKENRPEQTIYKLQPKGLNEFVENLTYFLNSTQKFYYDMDAITPFISFFGLLKKKKFILNSIKKQIDIRKDKFKNLEDGKKLVRSHYLFDLNPFMILPLEHQKLQNESEIKWLEIFHEMVDKIDFQANAKEIMKRRMEMEKENIRHKKET